MYKSLLVAILAIQVGITNSALAFATPKTPTQTVNTLKKSILDSAQATADSSRFFYAWVIKKCKREHISPQDDERAKKIAAKIGLITVSATTIAVGSGIFFYIKNYIAQKQKKEQEKSERLDRLAQDTERIKKEMPQNSEKIRKEQAEAADKQQELAKKVEQDLKKKREIEDVQKKEKKEFDRKKREDKDGLLNEIRYKIKNGTCNSYEALFLIEQTDQFNFDTFFYKMEIDQLIALADRMWVAGLLNKQDTSGNTLLISAAENDKHALAKYLVTINADQDIYNNRGQQAQDFLFSAKWNSEDGRKAKEFIQNRNGELLKARAERQRIFSILKQIEQGASTDEIIKEHQVSQEELNRWIREYSIK